MGIEGYMDLNFWFCILCYIKDFTRNILSYSIMRDCTTMYQAIVSGIGNREQLLSSARKLGLWRTF
eukprot:scaffold2079_cov142-Skeletonema_marinoi.AAC.4